MAALGLFWFADAVGSEPASALGGLAVALVFGIGGPLAYRRQTHAGPEGIRIQGVRRVRRLAWPDVVGFEMLPHRTWRADRIGVRTRDGELVALIHQDAKGLAARPGGPGLLPGPHRTPRDGPAHRSRLTTYAAIAHPTRNVGGSPCKD